MIDISSQWWSRVAVIGVLGAALGLSACGRKGPLDPPPSASNALQPAPATADPGPFGAPPPQAGVDRDGKAIAPPKSGQRQPFILDWLVD